jgi:hypothetical protein
MYVILVVPDVVGTNLHNAPAGTITFIDAICVFTSINATASVTVLLFLRVPPSVHEDPPFVEYWNNICPVDALPMVAVQVI